MAKPAARIVFLEAALGVAMALVLVRSFVVQVVQHRTWAARAAARRFNDSPVAARRGRIYDRAGRLLAVSDEQYRVSISLNELRDTAALLARLPRLLNLSPARVAGAFHGDYPSFYGPFTAEQIEPIRDVRGVHLSVLYNRMYPMQGVADQLLGRLDPNGSAGTGGLEKSLDSLLQGRPGLEHYLVDAKGTRLPAPGAALVAPIAGDDITLTIDAELQGIAEAALRTAVAAHGARGGDIVLLDVHTGELLAVASIRTDSATHKLVSTASALVEPNEPGSTSKLFTVAALLRTGADTLPVNGEGGRWEQHIGRQVRVINDVDRLNGPVTLAMTVKYSSNIAISKFALELKPDDQFETLRDFGFGMPLGLGFPGEAGGKLERPARWANADYTRPSLGQGYEWEATAAQLATGYAAIANHGVLMQPTLVREVRNQQGRVTWRHTADTVRQAVSPAIAGRLMEYLAGATDSGGTGAQAQLDRYRVVGKTGTADVGHKRGYRTSFVGIFTGDNPQAVIYIMIDQPTQGGQYGGTVAAPVERTVLQQALAVLHSPLDISQLSDRVAMAPVPRAPDLGNEPVNSVAVPLMPTVTTDARVGVPSVTDLSLREAIMTLERAGLEVQVQGRGHVRSTSPAAGDSLARRSVVTLYADST